MLRYEVVRFCACDAGSQIAEYSLALAFFVIVTLIAVEAVGIVATTQVTNDEGRYAGAFSTGS